MKILKTWKRLLSRFKFIVMEAKPFKVDVIRQPSKPDWTLSTFYFNGIKKGVGVEDEKREVKVMGETRVDNGIYDLDLRFSPKFSNKYYRDDEGNLLYAKYRKTEAQERRFHTPHEMVWVTGTPRHEFVLWHWGNTDDDTDACYIVGTSFGVFGQQMGVTASRFKYEEIYPELWRAIKSGKAIIEYKDELLT